MRAHDPVLVADAISDLPGVRNFHSSDVSLYQDLPETPYQVFMRRSPPPWCASAGERAEVGDSMVKPIISYLNDIWCKEIEREGARVPFTNPPHRLPTHVYIIFLCLALPPCPVLVWTP